MKRLRFLVLALALLCLPTLTHAQQLLNAPGGSPAGCTWTVTSFGGAAVQTSNVACLASYTHVIYAAAANGGTPTAVVSPAIPAITPIVNVHCAITAPGSTTVGCLAPAGQSTMIIYGFAW